MADKNTAADTPRPGAKPITDPKTYSCKKCNEIDIPQMVQCDSCNLWFHFTCVGVDETIQNLEWKCEDCTNNKADTASVKSHTNSVRSTRSRQIKLQLQRLEEERVLQEKRRAQQDDSTDDDDDHKLAEETVCEKQFRVVEYQQLQVDEQLPAASGAQVCAPRHQVRDDCQTIAAPGVLPRASQIVESGNPAPNLTSSQLAARQALPNELPTFSGRPDEWPIFISSFEGSTAACGITNLENILRLQKCLKGPALEAVRSRLLFPQNVPSIIATLKLIFGRPEIIIQSLLQKVRAEPNPKTEKLDTIISFALAVDNMCSTMEACGMSNHLNNPVLLQELIEKLPAQIKLNWATYSTSLDSNLSTFGTWLMQLASTVSRVTYTIPQFTTSLERKTAERGHVAVHNDSPVHNDNTAPTGSGTSRRICCICNQSCTKVEDCSTFAGLNTDQRWDVVKQNKLCRLCLFSHIRSRCRLTAPCGINACTYKHHRLLHNYAEDNVPTATAQIHTHDVNTHSASVFFRIIPAIVYGKKGPMDVFVFLDEGSSLSLMDESLAQELEVQGQPEELCLKWTGDTHRIERNSKIVSIEISPQGSSRRHTVSDMRTVSALKLPTQSICIKSLVSNYPYLKGLPISSYTSATPRILIGLNNWNLGTQLNFREGRKDQPIASKTRLGWTIYGPCHPESTFSSYSHIHHSSHHCEYEKQSDDHLHDMIKEYFALDSLGVTTGSLQSLTSPEDQLALQLMESETVRCGDQYETGLLWKNDQAELPNSYPMAFRRYKCLKAKMDRNPDLKANLNCQISEYLKKSYIRKLSKEELEENYPRTWYLPVFPVMNPKKPGKIRIVWDAAAKVGAISLNSALLKGPDQLTSLLGVLHRFRERKIAICGDIREMFHQVRIKKEDQHAQRFLWNLGESNKNPEVYVTQVMTFGATCSPSCAQFVKNKNALAFVDEYPRAVKCILENHYVDDLLDIVDTEAEAIQLCKEVKLIHRHGGFDIGKWISNSPAVVSELGEGPLKQSRSLSMSLETEADKVLGMWWSTSSDCFTYVVTRNGSNKELLEGNQKPTKREVLRILMTIYDPLGLIAHFLVYLKILLQDIWRSSIGWDDQITEQQFDRWRQWIKMLDSIEKLTIPRIYLANMNFDNEVDTELHIFVDASSTAFAAVAYFRCTRGDLVECRLVSATTRVAPLKLVSIPRLELEAAKLGVRLANSIAKEHSINISRKVFWSDSKTVLSWIRADHRRYRQFVAFRVSEILESTNVDDWRYVPTKLNVADEGTKWQKKPTFESNGQWFTGPPFLLLLETQWPANVVVSPTAEEEIQTKTHLFVHRDHDPKSVIDATRFSKWMRLLKATAFVFRFAHNIRQKPKKLPGSSGHMTTEELQRAEAYLYRKAQLDVYHNELLVLASQQAKPKHQRMLDRSSLLYKISPYIDTNGVLRCYGRIDAAKDVDRDVKRPIILPRGHQVTNLLIQHMHQKFHHLHYETVVNELRQKYWIPHIRAAVKEVLKHCQHCKNQRALPQPPMMGKLPHARLATYHRPFSYSGIDFFGPMTVAIGRRTEKRWGVLITCMTTRAVHIEVATSLSSDACILAIKRFIARRWTPIEFHCDNGTNFHGADNELQKAYKRQSDLAEKLSSTTTKWIFNPPSSPHMGGTWERMVQTVKKVLGETSPNRNPSDELLYSMLLEVENIINCHPLTYLPLDTEEDEALTPNHFLLGSSDGHKPESIIVDDRSLLRKQWMTSQQYANRFWKRWLKEYLPTLTRRGKWWAPAKPIEVGDVVIIVDDANPRNLWPKGRVVKRAVSSDGQVRQVTVKTRDGTYIRPAVKIAVLDIQDGKSVPTAIPGGSVNDNGHDH